MYVRVCSWPHKFNDHESIVIDKMKGNCQILN